jgi:hypothetical protein
MGDELGAMATIQEAMEALDDDEVKRVARWTADKFGGAGPSPAGPGPRSFARSQADGGAGSPTGSDSQAFERLVDLVDAAKPSDVPQYVLVVSYWFQCVLSQESFSGQQVNAALKDLGHPAKKITDAYRSLMRASPPLVRQVRKSGTTRQARKLYRLTVEGTRTVEQMLAEQTG